MCWRNRKKKRIFCSWNVKTKTKKSGRCIRKGLCRRMEFGFNYKWKEKAVRDPIIFTYLKVYFD